MRPHRPLPTPADLPGWPTRAAPCAWSLADIRGATTFGSAPVSSSSCSSSLRHRLARMVEHPTEEVASTHRRPSLRGVVRVHRGVSPGVASPAGDLWMGGFTAPASSPTRGAAPRPPCARRLAAPRPGPGTFIVPPGFVRPGDPRQRLAARGPRLGLPRGVGKVARRPHPALTEGASATNGLAGGWGGSRGSCCRAVDVVTATTWVGRRHKACLRRQSLRRRGAEPWWFRLGGCPPGRRGRQRVPGSRRRPVTLRRRVFGWFHERRIESFVRPLRRPDSRRALEDVLQK